MCCEGGGQTEGYEQTKEKPRTNIAKPFSPSCQFALCVTDGISKGKLTGKARTKFIATVASSIFGVKRSTKIELQDVAKQIAAKYPFVGATTDNLVSYK